MVASSSRAPYNVLCSHATTHSGSGRAGHSRGPRGALNQAAHGPGNAGSGGGTRFALTARGTRSSYPSRPAGHPHLPPQALLVHVQHKHRVIYVTATAAANNDVTSAASCTFRVLKRSVGSPSHLKGKGWV